MRPNAKWKERIDRHRARGRGRRAFWVLVLGAALIAGIGLVQGFGHERAGSQHGRHFATAASPEQIADRVDQMLDHLDVTDIQRERITALVDELSPELVELSAQREALRDQIVAALAAKELTPIRTENLKKQVSEQSGQLAERTLEIAFEIASELTPEQRTELIERWERR
jgi:Spy/CpxP family protein refolding chaperone